MLLRLGLLVGVIVLCCLPASFGAGTCSTSVRSGNVTVCQQLSGCGACQTALADFNLTCGWCQTHGTCLPLAQTDGAACASGWCHGAGCEQYCMCSSFLPCSTHWLGQVLLMGFYGFVLSFGAKMIGDGSELLLEIMDPGIIGGLVLPVLGAVPDSMMVLASGVAGSRADAQTQLQIGMGTLAGSTIMLNTLVWSISLILGRCDIRHGEAVDRRCTHPFWSRQAWLHSGVTVDRDTMWNARIMLGVTLSYFIVQGVAFAYLGDPDSKSAERMEKWFALSALIVAVVLLVAYCAYQVIYPRLQEKKIAEAKREYQRRLVVSRWMHMMQRNKSTPRDDEESSPLLDAPAPAPAPAPPPVDVRAVGLRWKAKAAASAAARVADPTTIQENDAGDDDDDDDDNETAGMTKQQIAVKAIVTLVIGTAIVTLFSDPMVEVIDDFGTTIGISPFLLSFILTPLCSNASEIISSFMFAMKKRRQNISLTFSQIFGAATMNGTLVAGVFYALVFFRQLNWTYSAETLSIVVVSFIVGVPNAMRSTFQLWWIVHVVLLYPLSLVFVFLLEKFACWT